MNRGDADGIQAVRHSTEKYSGPTAERRWVEKEEKRARESGWSGPLEVRVSANVRWRLAFKAGSFFGRIEHWSPVNPHEIQVQ